VGSPKRLLVLGFQQNDLTLDPLTVQFKFEVQ
jgi:hypothetical protein